MNRTTSIEPRPLRVLLVDDSPDDALLLLRALRRGGFAPEHARVDTASAMLAALARGGWDLVISDYTIPGFGALEALEIIRRHAPNLPFIIVSGHSDDEVVAGAKRAGALDYLPKQDLTRLVPAISDGIGAAGRQ